MRGSKDLDFTDQRILVTGAASGIGLAIAEGFAAHGGKLIVADIEIDRLKIQAETLGANVSVHQYDQGDPSSIANLAATVGPVDIFCNNAGMNHAGPLLEQSPKIIKRIIAIDLLGPILLARYIGEDNALLRYLHKIPALIRTPVILHCNPRN